MTEKIYILNMDNGSCNNGKKIKIETTKDCIEYEAKRFFGWRTPTKQYKTIVDRVYKLGSSDYDEFILHLSKLGY